MGMGQRARILTEILGFDGWRVKEAYFESATGERVVPVGGFALLRETRLMLVVERRWLPRCGQCGGPCRDVHERLPPRRWADLPWAEHPVELWYAPVRVECPRCIATPVEMVAWADPYQRQTRRLQQRLAVEAASMPVMHVAAIHGLSWLTVRRAEERAIERWEATRPVVPLRQAAVDEKWLGRRHVLDHKFVTLVSNLETGEPLWIGSARSCVNLGAMHSKGDGVPKNESLGARFFLRGCEAGAAEGCLNVSLAYGGGQGVPKDLEFAYAQRACTGGAAGACARVERARIAGDGVAKDVKGGLAQLDGMCARRDAAACESLAKLYGNGMGPDVVADPLRVREYAKKACDLGSTVGCQLTHFAGIVDKGESSGASDNGRLQTQCDGGYAVACGMLGENLLDGRGVSVDRAKGTALLKRACEGGFDRACKRLGEGSAE
jgi:hypothetical protein